MYKIKLLDSFTEISDKIKLVGDIQLYYELENIIFDIGKIKKLVSKHPEKVRYVIGNVDIIIENNDSIDVMSSSSSSGIYFVSEDGQYIFSKDERKLFGEKQYSIPDLKHQIMARKYNKSVYNEQIYRNSPLLKTRIQNGEISSSLNLKISTQRSSYETYYANLGTLINKITDKMDIDILFSGGIDSALMALHSSSKADLIHYKYKDHSALESRLAKKVSGIFKNKFLIKKPEKEYDIDLVDDYFKKIYPAVVGYKMKFNWKDYTKKKYLLTGQNADSFIYGDSFNKSNLRGRPGRWVINLISLHKRLSYYIFSNLYLSKKSFLGLLGTCSINDKDEHSTMRISDFFVRRANKSKKNNELIKFSSSVEVERATILEWIKILKIARILHNVNYGGWQISKYTGIERINPYSSAALIEQALSLPYTLGCMFIPKKPSYTYFRNLSGKSFFQSLDATDTFFGSLQKRNKEDHVVEDTALTKIAASKGITGWSIRSQLNAINFKTWISER